MNKNQYPNPNSNSTDSIDLVELYRVIIKGKWTIISVTALFSIITVIYSLLLPNIYQSQAILAPVDSSNSISGAIQSYSGLAGLAGINLPPAGAESNAIKAINKLSSLSFFKNNVLPNIFLPDLMAVKSWDYDSKLLIYDDSIYLHKTNSWVRDYSYPFKQIPSPQESYKKFQDKHFRIIEDKKTGFVTILTKHQSPILAKEWTEIFVNEINAFYREKDKLESQKAVSYLNNQITKTNLSEIKQVIAELLKQETQKLTLIEANQFYVFDYIDPPAIMEIKLEPRRSIICIIGAFFGALLGIILVIIRHFF